MKTVMTVGICDGQQPVVLVLSGTEFGTTTITLTVPTAKLLVGQLQATIEAAEVSDDDQASG